MAHPGGRPPVFRSVGEIQEKIDAYFAQCEGKPLTDEDGNPLLDKRGNVILVGIHPPTITGLALALGFKSRQSLLDYQAKKEFSDTVTRAKMQVEAYAEERLFDRDGQRGAEFTLKYNFRWEQDWERDGNAGGVVMLAPVKEQEKEQHGREGTG